MNAFDSWNDGQPAVANHTTRSGIATCQKWAVALASALLAGAAHAEVTCNNETYLYRAFGFHAQSLTPTLPKPPCNPATFASAGPTGPWSPGPITGAGAGGDVVNVSVWASGTIAYIEMDANDLVVTPVSFLSSGSLAVSALQISATQFSLTVTSSLSDSGAAARVRMYGYTGSLDTPIDGDNTALPNWSTASTLLNAVEYHGTGGTDVLSVTLASPTDQLVVVGNLKLASLAPVPEPATWAGMLAGLALLACRRSVPLRARKPD